MRKTAAGAIALIAVAALGLNGTLSYFASTSATNAFTTKALTKDVKPHDDLVGTNKDVYMENLGSSTVWVRVKLTEDFKIGQKGKNGDEKYLTGWSHVDKTASTNGMPYGEHVHKGAEAVNDCADSDGFHKNYYQWVMGGPGKKFISASSKLYDSDGDADKNGVFWGGDDGKVAQNNSADQDSLKRSSLYDPSDVKTAPDCKVISIAAYKEMLEVEKDAFVGWIQDTDGWCYWSQPLASGGVTGLLLNEVKPCDAFAQNDYDSTYHIHVQYEAVDGTDMGLWLGIRTTDSDGNPVTTEKASDAIQEFLTLSRGQASTETTSLNLESTEALPVAEQEAVTEEQPVVTEETLAVDAADTRTPTTEEVESPEVKTSDTETLDVETPASSTEEPEKTELEEQQDQVTTSDAEQKQEDDSKTDKDQISTSTEDQTSEQPDSTHTENPTDESVKKQE